MSFRNRRLSSDLRDIVSLTGLNGANGPLSDLNETIDRSLSFSEQKDLIQSGTTTLNDGIKSLLDTSTLGNVGEAILGSYASNIESELLSTLDDMSAVMLQRLDAMATGIQNKVAKKIIPLSALVKGYQSASSVYATAASAFLSIEALLESRTIEEVLGNLESLSDDSWYEDMISWTGLSLLNRRDYRSLSTLMDTISSSNYEVIIEDIYVSLLTHMTSAPKEVGTVSAIGDILSRLNTAESARLIRSLERFRPTREKLERLATTFKSANVLHEVVDETVVSFRATDVIQAKLI
jgi:hypothetical protein